MRMRDIADAAGVSTMTVSRALKADSSIAPATRAAILRIIEDMGYVPNQIAGSLSSRRSGFVAVLVPSLNNLHFSETVLALGDRLSKLGIQPLIGNTNYDSRTEASLVRAFLARKPEAIVLTNDGHTRELRQVLAKARIPVVEIWDLPDDPIQHVVGFSNRSAMRDLVVTMANVGYRRITYLGESDDAGMRGASRRQGYLDAIFEHGLEKPRVCLIGKPPAKMSDGDAAFDIVMREFPETDLIVCVSDQLAFGVIAAAQKRGVKVPEAIAVAGFGDFEISRVAVPDITTVSVNPTEIGALTAELIGQLLSPEGTLQTSAVAIQKVQPRMMLRASAPGR